MLKQLSLMKKEIMGEEAGGGATAQRAGVPRVYVPITASESSVPTYAVLELVGFSSPATEPQNHSGAVVAAATPPLQLTLSGSSAPPQILSPPPLFFNQSPFLAAPPNYNTPGSGSNLIISPYSRQQTVAATGGCGKSPQIVLLESPPVSPSGDYSRKSKSRSEQPVSICQTDRETVVHASSSNFKDVVRQLTGASADDAGLMPVTLPARLANRAAVAAASVDAVAPAAASVPVTRALSDAALKPDLGLRKAPLKLHERRKALRNLERLSTTTGACFRSDLGSSSSSSSSSSPLAPSPVTPLASDFERFCNATTPTAQQQQQQQSSASVVLPSSSSSSPRPQFDSMGKIAVPVPVSAYSHMIQGFGHGVPASEPVVPYEKNPPVLLNLFPEGPLRS